mmetsp:Transcript_81059/g.143343  ORF Transcript_81059/g.143343 Transcript_81059/m.143343 type:complete len:228 (-) Transcript_81059:675-1358(-)
MPGWNLLGSVCAAGMEPPFNVWAEKCDHGHRCAEESDIAINFQAVCQICDSGQRMCRARRFGSHQENIQDGTGHIRRELDDLCKTWDRRHTLATSLLDSFDHPLSFSCVKLSRRSSIINQNACGESLRSRYILSADVHHAMEEVHIIVWITEGCQQMQSFLRKKAPLNGKVERRCAHRIRRVCRQLHVKPRSGLNQQLRHFIGAIFSHDVQGIPTVFVRRVWVGVQL